jgi:exonuclease III
MLDGYTFVSKNRNHKNGGGVGMYVSNKLNFKMRPDLSVSETDIIESIFVEITSTIGKNIIIGTIYRPPNGNFEIFETKLNDVLYSINKTSKNAYLMGDFNIDLLKSDQSDYSNRFSEQLFTSTFFPLISKPTRITPHTATLIDNIFTNDYEQIETSKNGIIFTDISYHFPIFHFANTSIHHQLQSDNSYHRKIDIRNLSSFSNAIQNMIFFKAMMLLNLMKLFLIK